MSVTLERIKIEARPSVSEDVKQIARDAKLILGYNELAETVIGSQESLSDVLRRLDIQPYSPVSVKAYKKDRIKALEAEGGYHYWWRESLRKAHGVPPFVLRKAVQIARAAPEVLFFIERVANHADPFLIAKLGREEYYIEVWDEADFEKGLVDA